MSVLVFAQRYVPPPPPDQLAGWKRYQLTWHGWDGSEWDLRNWRDGVFVTNEGVVGLDDPQFVAETHESAATSGRTRTDYRVSARTVELPVYVYSDDSSAAWLQRLRDFRRSFHPLYPGYLELRTELGTRTIELYLDSSGDFSYTRDPVFVGYSRYRIQLTAEDPFWKGPVWQRTFASVSPEAFFGVDGNLHVATSATLETAAVTNDGDEDAWVKFTLTAGGSDITAGITIAGGELGPPLIPAGSTLVIDTDPAVGSADLDGVEVDGSVDPWDPRPAPPRQSIPVTLDLDGYGTVTMELQPRYWRAL